MRRPTTTALVLVASAALTLSACGRAETDGAGGEPQTGTDVAEGAADGTITVWAMGAEGEKLPDLAAQFEEENPGAKVNVTAIPWDAAHDKFTTAITANSLPDAAMVGTTWMGEFAGLDALDPLPENLEADGFFEGAQGTTEVDGTSYGIPWYVETRLLYYRTDLAEQAGFDEAPTTWEGLKEMAKAMQTEAGAEYGIGLQAGGTGSWQTVMPFAWGEGAELTDGEGYTFDTPEMLEAVEYYQSFFDEGIANKSAPAQPTTEPDFVSGDVPMFISGPWMMSAVEEVGGEGFEDKYSVAKIPEGSAGSSSFVGGSDFVVFKSSQERDTAWKFVEFLADPEVQATWYDMSTDLPSVQSAWDTDALASDEKLSVFGEQLETAKAPPSYPTWEQVVASLDTELEKVTKTGADPAEALKTVQQQADSIGTGQ